MLASFPAWTLNQIALDSGIPIRSKRGTLLSPARRRACIDHVRSELRLSERRICRVLGQHRSPSGAFRRGRTMRSG
jgi:hypothetical protein